MIDGNERWLTLQEAADHLNISLSWLYQNANRHGFPMSRVGRTYRCRRDEIDRWMASQPR